jgi:replicative DNA helicase
MYHISVKQGKNVLFFSLEMNRMEVLERLFAQAAGVDSSKLRSGNLQAKDFNDLCFASEKLEKAPFWVDDRSILTPYDVLAQANRLRSNLNITNPGQKIDLIVVDYIQIMKSGSNYENRSLEVASITGGLKAIAKELGVPVVALSQLNRDGSKRAGTSESKKPQLSDLKDSGSIEADADVVMFIHREQGSETDSRAPAPAEIIVAKQRGGPTGTIPVVWLGHLTQFSDAIDSSHMPEGIPEGPGEYHPGPDTY